MSAACDKHGCGLTDELTTSRTTKYRTHDNKQLVQIVEDMNAWPPLLRELANRVSEIDRLSRRAQHLEEELGRRERHFGPLP